MENKIIKELKCITIEEEGEDIAPKILLIWVVSTFIVLISLLVSIYFLVEPERLSSDQLQTILKYVFWGFLYCFSSIFITISIEEYMTYSKNKFIEFKKEKIKELINLSLKDYKLFRFILFKIDNEKIKENFVNYIYYNDDILKKICENPHLLLVINEMPINENTEDLITKIQKYLEEERRREIILKRKRKTFEKSINEKMKQEIKII